MDLHPQTMSTEIAYSILIGTRDHAFMWSPHETHMYSFLGPLLCPYFLQYLLCIASTFGSFALSFHVDIILYQWASSLHISYFDSNCSARSICVKIPKNTLTNFLQNIFSWLPVIQKIDINLIGLFTSHCYIGYLFWNKSNIEIKLIITCCCFKSFKTDSGRLVSSSRRMNCDGFPLKTGRWCSALFTNNLKNSETSQRCICLYWYPSHRDQFKVITLNQSLTDVVWATAC